MIITNPVPVFVCLYHIAPHEKPGRTYGNNICGDEIESKHRHDFVTCKCGACSVDGGHDYLRRCFMEEGCYTDMED